jgi:hypothetical protein
MHIIFNLTDTTITVYNINAVSGWNAFTIKLDVQRPDYSQYSYTSGETGGATWRYMTMTVPLTSRMKLY